jgi:hypothetical protein
LCHSKIGWLTAGVGPDIIGRLMAEWQSKQLQPNFQSLPECFNVWRDWISL